MVGDFGIDHARDPVSPTIEIDTQHYIACIFPEGEE